MAHRDRVVKSQLESRFFFSDLCFKLRFKLDDISFDVFLLTTRMQNLANCAVEFGKICCAICGDDGNGDVCVYLLTCLL